jgi:beta-xylosidase
VSRQYPVQVPETSDEFDNNRLGLQWQWHANPLDQWLSFSARRGWLRLAAMPWPEDRQNLWAVPNLLLQKLPARSFTVTTLVDASHLLEGERSGLLMMGRDYSYVAVVRTSASLRVVRVTCLEAPKKTPEKEIGAVELKSKSIYLRITVADDAICEFSYSLDRRRFERLGETFRAQPGIWIGAKVGLFSLAPAGAIANGYAEYNWFRFDPQTSRTDTDQKKRSY